MRGMKRAVLLALTCLAAAPAAWGAPSFRATIEPIDRELRREMTGVSWHRGCPVHIRDLRVIRLTRWNYKGKVRPGKLVVHKREARPVKRVMRKLFEARFPFRRMALIDRYGGSDDRSMNANNTSAFNCRYVAGTSRWSQHAYGRAIDINPVQNPYVSNGVASPDRGQRWVDRSRRHRGMIHGGDIPVRAFAAAGWSWGGYWSSPRDYQHFSATGS
jgi:D-alanyl-D-alanine carboxypeptidase